LMSYLYWFLMKWKINEWKQRKNRIQNVRL
jgi:hypothetical protein